MRRDIAKLVALLVISSSAAPSLARPRDVAWLQARDAEERTHRDDWTYPIAALRNEREGLVRIYGQYLQSVVGNDTKAGERSQVATCSFKGQEGGEEVNRQLPRKRPVEGLSFINENNTPNFIIDCELPEGNWATEVRLRLEDGSEPGRWLQITEMASERQGAWVACSQPLHTDREWLEDWIGHQFLMGASKVVLHAPQGPHVDELFDMATRQKRLEYNANFAERSPTKVGTTPLRRIQRENVEYFDYWPSPTAVYYAEELIFSLCHYRHRYAYDYSSQFDVDEFWVPTANVEEKTLPEFMNKRLPIEATHASFRQVFYPLSCATRTKGDYASRFTLYRKHTGQLKPAVRPLSVRRMHVHGMLDTSPEWKAWKAANGSHEGPQPVVFPIEEAFLKHIQPDNTIDNDNKPHYYKCAYGKELDPQGNMGVE